MNWHDKLKVALLNQDDKSAFALVSNLPENLAQAPLEEKLQALELISQTKRLLESKQLQARINMEQIKVNFVPKPYIFPIVWIFCNKFPKKSAYILDFKPKIV